MLIALVATIALGLPPQDAPARFTNWREAMPCLAVFDAAANRAHVAHQRNPDAGHGAAFQTWDEASMAMIDSANSRLSLAQAEQADRMRIETDATLKPLDDAAIFARAEECKARLPDPIKLP